jgi:hypothetical protein
MQYANGRDVRSARASLRTGRRTRGRERAPWPRAGRPRRIRVAGGANRRGDAREPPRARHRRTLHYGEAALCALSWTPPSALAPARSRKAAFDAPIFPVSMRRLRCAKSSLRRTRSELRVTQLRTTARILRTAYCRRRGARAHAPRGQAPQRCAPFFPRSSASRNAFPSAPSSAFSAFFPRSSTRFGFAAARSAPAS